MRHLIFLYSLFVLLAFVCVENSSAETPEMVGCGALDVVGAAPGSTCPLTRTAISATVSGYVADVVVKQRFKNPFKKPIEAVYTFPLNESAAVYAMTIKNGNRIVEGVIKTREEAEKTYEAARKAGNTAGLLVQERPNVFRQSFANIEPGKPVDVEIHYTQYLNYDHGFYHLNFPTTIGERYGATADVVTATVSDMRSGHDVTIDVQINAPSGIGTIESAQHAIFMRRFDPTHARVSLLEGNEIPNRDFDLRWRVAAESIKTASIAEKTGTDGYFTFMFTPPLSVAPTDAAPKEVLFVIDRSGSQEGLGIESCRATAERLIHHLNPNDTFNIAFFNDETVWCFDRPQSPTIESLYRADQQLSNLSAYGGTEIGKAIKNVCDKPAENNRLRIVVLMTDGEVGNDFQLLSEVTSFRNNSRWFTFGTGSSVNRFLLDGIAREGGGEVQYVLQDSDPKKIAKEFFDKVSSPIMTDVLVKFSGNNAHVDQVFPHVKSDVWLSRPLYFTGHYTGSGTVSATVTGTLRGRPFTSTYSVPLPAVASKNPSIPRVWARSKVDDLMAQDWQGVQQGTLSRSLRKQISDVALEHSLMTQFTSFVAVDTSHALRSPGDVRVKVGNPSPAGTRFLEQQALSNPFISAKGFAPLVGAPVDPRFGQSNEVGTISDTYRGMHQWFNDDFVGNLLTQIGQLIGKWISEFVSGFTAELAYAAGTVFVWIVTLPTASDTGRLWIGAGLIAFVNGFMLALSCRRSTWSRISLVRMLSVLVPIMVPIALPVLMYLRDSLDCVMMPLALTAAIRGAVLVGIGGLTSAFAPLLGSVTLGFLGATIGQLIAFFGLFLESASAAFVDLCLCASCLLSGVAAAALVAQAILLPFCGFFVRNERAALRLERIVRWTMRCAAVLVCSIATLAGLTAMLMSDCNPVGKLAASVVILATDVYISARLMKLFVFQHFFRRKQIR